MSSLFKEISGSEAKKMVIDLRKFCRKYGVVIECYISVKSFEDISIRGFSEDEQFYTKEYSDGSYIGFEIPFCVISH